MALLVGCDSRTLPDPNDPRNAGSTQLAVIMANLRQASDVVNDRVFREEITDSQGHEFLATYASKLAALIDQKQIVEGQTWQYAEILRSAREWSRARVQYEKAVKIAKSEDRRVNDTLHLAQCVAELGDTEEALRLARSTFNAPKNSTAPILPACLLEIAPAAENKGQNEELAHLLLDAAKIHEDTVVDRHTLAGAQFWTVKRFHIARAMREAAYLLDSVGKKDEAEAARKRSEELHRWPENEKGPSLSSSLPKTR